MIQNDSLSVDTAASVREAKAFQEQLPELASTEASYLTDSAARAWLVTFRHSRSRRLPPRRVPSIAIGNFTWDWIYEGYPEESPFNLARGSATAYQKASTSSPAADGWRIRRSRGDNP